VRDSLSSVVGEIKGDGPDGEESDGGEEEERGPHGGVGRGALPGGERGESGA
jgi:hypothetical protein